MMRHHPSSATFRLLLSLISGVLILLCLLGVMISLSSPSPVAAEEDQPMSAESSFALMPPAIPMAQLEEDCYAVDSVTERSSSAITHNHPSISADGNFIAYVLRKEEESNPRVELLRYNIISGSEDSPLHSTDPLYYFALTSSSIDRDGDRIAFVSDANLIGLNTDNNREIFLYAIPATSYKVTQTSGFTATSNENPSISEDGVFIAFDSDYNLDGNNPDGNREIFRYDDTLKKITQVTSSTLGTNFQSSINSDGTVIAFVSNADLVGSNSDGNQEIFLYQDETNRIIQVTNTSASVKNTHPSISEDGTRIAFVSDRDGQSEIYAYDSTHSVVRITTSPGKTSDSPALSGDGFRVAFVSTGDLDSNQSITNTDANKEIFVATLTSDLTSSNFEQVTNTIGDKFSNSPSIDRIGSRIAFISNGDLDGTNDGSNSEVFVAKCDIVDLQITKSAPAAIKTGETIIYTFNIINNGAATATDVVLFDSLPDIKDNVGSETYCSNVNSGNDKLDPLGWCELKSDIGISKSIEIQLRYGKTDESGIVTNTAIISASQVERNTVDNEAGPIVTYIRTETEMTVTKTVTPLQTVKNKPITFTIVVTNIGDAPALDATLLDHLPSGIFQQKAITDNVANSFGSGTMDKVGINGNFLQLNGGESLGTYNRVMSSEYIVNWNKLSWVPQRPMGKALPDGQQSESGYPEGNADMSDNILLLHFTDGIVSPIDTSNAEIFNIRCYWYHPYYDSCPKETAGKFGDGFEFDGVDDYIHIYPSSPYLMDQFTVEVWVKPYNSGYGNPTIIALWDEDGDLLRIFRNGDRWYVASNGILENTQFEVDFDEWQYLALVVESDGTIRFHKNDQSHSTNLTSNFTDINYSIVSDYPWFKGAMDEIAIFDRALSPTEVTDHYLRGADLRLEFQVRSCDDPNCEGETFTSVPSGPTNSSTGPPSFDLNVTPNQYLEYQVTFTNPGNLSVLPALESVSLEHDDVNSVTFIPNGISCNDKGSILLCSMEALADSEAFSVTVVGTARTASIIKNTAIATSSSFLVDTSQSIFVSASAETTLGPVDLSIDKEAPAKVLAGGNLLYNIILTNNITDNIATEMRITDTLPLGLEFIPALSSSGCQENGIDSSKVICELDELAPKVSTTLIIAARPNLIETQKIMNHVEVRAANPEEEEGYSLDDNEDTASTEVIEAADLEVNKSVSSTSVEPNKPLTYTIIVQNRGPSAVSTIDVTDILTSDVAVDVSIPPSLDGSGSCNPVVGTIFNCSLGELTPNNLFTITYIVIPLEAGTITNTVSITTGSLPDPFLFNNVDTVQSVSALEGIYLPLIVKNH